MKVSLILFLIFGVLSADWKTNRIENIKTLFEKMTTSFIPDANLPSLNNVYLNLKEKMKLYPNLVKITDIGTSTQYRNIKSVEITNNINLLEIGKPSVRYIANMHGDEVVGLYLMHNFINYLTSQNDTFVNTLLDCLKFIIVPTMNPDAYYETYKYNNTHKQRNNLNNYDLNRNFPDRVITTVFPVQPETIAIMKWMNNSDVVLSANIHGGDVVVNYPFDGNMESTTIYTGTKDDDVFRHISLTYAKYNPRMGNNHSCYQNEKGFKYGITNGAAWYNVHGSLQDWVYINTNSMPVTIELSCKKYISKNESYVPFWNDNHKSLIAYSIRSLIGISGNITKYNSTYPIANVNVIVSGRNHIVKSTESGEFYRPLRKGTYDVIFQKTGYKNKTMNLVLTSNINPWMNVELMPIKSSNHVSNAFFIAKLPNYIYLMLITYLLMISFILN